MKRLENVTNDSFVKSLELNLKENSKYFFYLQSWQDGDAFLDVCDVDGGIKTEQVLLFAEKNKKYIFKKKSELLEITAKFIKNKSFASKNEVFKLGYDMYIICKKDYFVLCPELNKGYHANLNIFNRLIGFFAYKEPWENEKFGYWEKQTTTA